MQVNENAREVVFKVVYEGPPGSGKLTNLQEVHKLLDPRACGRLSRHSSTDAQVPCFDLLPVVAPGAPGYHVKLKLFCLPGQLAQAASRRIVLAGTDGLIFVADARRAQAQANLDHFEAMRRSLRETGSDPQQVPTVLQYNRRDQPDGVAEAELVRAAPAGLAGVHFAVATRGEGVLETLHGLLQAMLGQADRRIGLQATYGISVAAFLRQVFAHGLPQLFDGP